jgi:hypothetical protein
MALEGYLSGGSQVQCNKFQSERNNLNIVTDSCFANALLPDIEGKAKQFNWGKFLF